MGGRSSGRRKASDQPALSCTLPSFPALWLLCNCRPHHVAGSSVTASAGSPERTATSKKNKRRRSSGEGEEEAQGGHSQWAFLAQMDAVDQSWLHFALFSAYQQQKWVTNLWS